MIRVIVKNGNIERALKQYKRKYKNTKVINEINKRKEYKKPSVKNREVINKATYINKKKNND
jgi:small subunit ribosomal protein S21